MQQPAVNSLALPQGWSTVETLRLPGQTAEFEPVDRIGIPSPVLSLLAEKYPRGVYRHQREAIAAGIRGEHVCLATGTGSGKTLAFSAVALHHLLSDSEAKVIALYPMKALAHEQVQRWRAELRAFGFGAEAVQVVVGGVLKDQRERAAREARVVVMTPDVLHAWVMSNLDNATIRALLANLRLVVVDEVHTYSGVFGSNAAFLFRRLRLAAAHLGAAPRFFAASATIRDPGAHAKQLIGEPVTIVGEASDSSARSPVAIQFVEGPSGQKLLEKTVGLLRTLLHTTDHRFLAFADSRKMVESICVLLRPGKSTTAETPAGGDEPESSESATEELAHEADHDDHGGHPVMPYRSGYQEHDRQRIQRELTTGILRGIVSTSALELGLDISGLDVAVLIGVPSSGTSLRQRIGRVGRSRPGLVLVVRGDTPIDDAVFRNPASLLQRQLADSTLYLGNLPLQCMQAICLADHGRELSTLFGTDDWDTTPDAWQHGIDWPEGFAEMVRGVRSGNVSPELHSLLVDGGEKPHIRFPLRDIGRQFQLIRGTWVGSEGMGEVTSQQAMRETYPGAIYYHMGRAFRVRAVSTSRREITLTPAKRNWFTSPIMRQIVYPCFGGGLLRAVQFGELGVFEAELAVTESVLGFEEKRGGKKTQVQYPLRGQHERLHFKDPAFNHRFRTTGVLFHHPACDSLPAGVVDSLSALILDAALLLVPLDRGDLAATSGMIKGDTPVLSDASRFASVYDRTHGSLRLSSWLADPANIPGIIMMAAEIARNATTDTPVSPELLEVLAMLEACVAQPPALRHVGPALEDMEHPGRTRIICPGSVGASLRHGSIPFQVKGVFMHPQMGLAYRGTHGYVAGQTETIPATDLGEMPGESVLGWYDLDTGEVIEGADSASRGNPMALSDCVAA